MDLLRVGLGWITLKTMVEQASGWFGSGLGCDYSGETHLTGITGTSELLDGEGLLSIGDRDQ